MKSSTPVYDVVSSVEDSDPTAIAVVSAETVEVANANAVHEQQPSSGLSSSSSSYAHLVSGLTWQDRYYENERDIVAVFDVDEEGIKKYNQTKMIHFMIATLVSALFAALNFALEQYFWYGMCLVAVVLHAFVAIIQRKKLECCDGVHMALTTSCIRYDQEANALHLLIPFSTISMVTVAEKKINSALCCCNKLVLPLVEIKLHGQGAKSFVGIQNVQEFQRLIMALKEQNIRAQAVQV